MMNVQELLESKKKYEYMYWKKFHECKRLKQLLKDNGLGYHLEEKNDSIDDKYLGTIIKLGPYLDYGFIKSDINPYLFFHISECENFELNESILNKQVSFTINRKMDKIQATDIYYNGDIPKDNTNNTINSHLDMLNDYIPSLSSIKTNIDKPSNLNIDDSIIDSPNIWYMNAHENSLKYWEESIKSGFVITWNPDNRNNNVFYKLNNNDIIAWYVRGKGYIAILKVKQDPRKMTEADLDSLSSKHNHYCEYSRNWWKENGITIPVDFLSYVKPPMFVNNKNIPSVKDWTHGLRGSSCMHPSSGGWKKQVIEMYKYMKKINLQTQ